MSTNTWLPTTTPLLGHGREVQNDEAPYLCIGKYVPLYARAVAAAGRCYCIAPQGQRYVHVIVAVLFNSAIRGAAEDRALAS